MHARLLGWALLAAALAQPGFAACAARAGAPGPASLAIWHQREWRTFWRSESAPDRWSAPDPEVARSLRWARIGRGVEWASLRLACGVPAWRARLIVARVDPREVRLGLAMDHTRELRPAWSVDRAPRDALLAVNAGQFGTSLPWGWVVIDGRERLHPGAGPLSSTIAIDAAGDVHWAHGKTLAPNGVVTAFQSYPTLLAGDGVVPRELRTPGSGVSLTHHDARLALGETRDGYLLIVMTRFDAIGKAAEFVPLGPTTPEMAAVMGALGATDAVLLDGGISAQLLLRDPARHREQEWKGLRKVPLGLIARPRALGAALAKRGP